MIFHGLWLTTFGDIKSYEADGLIVKFYRCSG